MPSISPPAKVLVTGASGFLAAHVCQALLSRGFNVRGTVRSPAKGEYLRKLFHKETKARFEYVIVQDMQAPNAYDEAVKSMDAVEHVASPVSGLTGDAEEAVRPAVRGTLGVLESVKRYGSNVKRVVITSSKAAIGGGMRDTEWNQAAVDALNRQGKDAPEWTKYNASKVLAERAAWAFVEKNRSDIGFDIVTLCPPWIFGPNIHQGGISDSDEYFLKTLDPKNKKVGPELTARAGAYIDVRDVSAIHVDVLMKSKAGGERFITTRGFFAWIDVYRALDVPFEVPTEEAGPFEQFDQTKLCTVLERSSAEMYRPLEVSLKDALESARERGWDVKFH